MVIDKFDIMAFVVLGTFVIVGLVVIVTLGSLPGRIAAKRGHPQAKAINAASWVSLATLGDFVADRICVGVSAAAGRRVFE